VGGEPRGRERSPELGPKQDSRFRQDVLEGLARPPRWLPPKYFYDAAGSRLFERICRLREYYPTRVELGITRRHLRDIARFAGKGCALLEYGSGESLKTRLLIRALRPAVYMPVDISADALDGAVDEAGGDALQPVMAFMVQMIRLRRGHQDAVDAAREEVGEEIAASGPEAGQDLGDGAIQIRHGGRAGIERLHGVDQHDLPV